MMRARRDHVANRRGRTDVAFCHHPARRIVPALLLALAWADAVQAFPVDAHLYAEDTAREIAAKVKPGAILLVDAPGGYYQMAVIAQLKTRGFTVTEGGVANGMTVRYSLVDADRSGAARVDLAIDGNVFRRMYEARSGKPAGEWSIQVVAQKPVGQALDEPDQLYRLGRGVESRSAVRAMQYYRLAADLGQIDAALRLGLMLIAGSKAKEGIRYVIAASNAGNAQAQYVLGLAYLDGTGIAREPASGRALIRKAADAGIPAARQALGREVIAARNGNR